MLLEDHVAPLAADHGAAALPLDGGIRIDARAREAALPLKSPPGFANRAAFARLSLATLGLLRHEIPLVRCCLARPPHPYI